MKSQEVALMNVSVRSVHGAPSRALKRRRGTLLLLRLSIVRSGQAAVNSPTPRQNHLRCIKTLYNFIITQR